MNPGRRPLPETTMTRVLRLGANGPLARYTTRVFLAHPAVALTRCLRRAGRLENPDPSRATIVDGERLAVAMPRRDVGAPRPQDRSKDV
uniref:Uncharacterized protein n=2 Tax=Ralstonia TaxID=48736 RepID=A0A0S4VL76_RALSL|nr:conserved protein of unknown function [Ralstonia solanacearum]CUV35034.1 conserved protein of unknown function [Ralstonia solanacearum]CUV38476.1 conserved protein of unknown function [Ralstonia solanacearum]CUV59113.1 conserved protein of unknown function [Ralstonia solanacearum]